MIKKIILLIGLNLFVSTAFGQDKLDSLAIQNFKEESILPLINKDTEKLSLLIEFPLKGEWGYMMELQKDEKDWTKEDFFENYDKLFDDKVIGILKTLDYENINLYKSEILVGINLADDEFAIILRYRYIKGKWKLYVIQGVG